VVPVIDALAETVGALHDNEIVQRDLKPSNILLRSDARADTGGPGKLVARHERLLNSDLGLARDLRRATTSMSSEAEPITTGHPSSSTPERRSTTVRRVRGHGRRLRAADRLGAPHRGPGTGAPVGPKLHRALEQGLAPDREERFGSMARRRQCLLDAVDGRSLVSPSLMHAEAGKIQRRVLSRFSAVTGPG
jgi:serine/threonine protein kinase